MKQEEKNIINFDYASLYPTTMRDDLNEKMIKKMKQKLRKEKMEKINQYNGT